MVSNRHRYQPFLHSSEFKYASRPPEPLSSPSSSSSPRPASPFAAPHPQTASSDAPSPAQPAARPVCVHPDPPQQTLNKPKKHAEAVAPEHPQPSPEPQPPSTSEKPGSHLPLVSATPPASPEPQNPDD